MKATEQYFLVLFNLLCCSTEVQKLRMYRVQTYELLEWGVWPDMDASMRDIILCIKNNRISVFNKLILFLIYQGPANAEYST